MRVLHVNFDAGMTGGATIAMCRIHQALLGSAVDSRIVCRLYPKAPAAVNVARSLGMKVTLFVCRVIMKLISGCCRSTGLVPTGLHKSINFFRPDAVVLHWIQNDTIAIRELLKIDAPIFWYHHDLWPLRGITAYEWFKVPPRLGWLDRLSKWNKQCVVKRMGRKLIPVCASKWVADEIRKSGMYAHAPVIIPLPLDEMFKPGIRNPGRKFRILNGAQSGFDIGIKGGDRLLAAMQQIPEAEKIEMEIVVFGGAGKDEIRDGVSIRFIGRLQGEALVQAYRDADVFAFPSRQETFGQTKIEALACGTPVVAFDETACAEGIVHGKNGWIAAANDINGFALGIRHFYHAWKNGHVIRVKGDDGYRATVIASQWSEMIRQKIPYHGVQ